MVPSPFDFTACGGYAQDERRKDRGLQSPVRAEPFDYARDRLRQAQDRLRASEVEARGISTCRNAQIWSRRTLPRRFALLVALVQDTLLIKRGNRIL